MQVDSVLFQLCMHVDSVFFQLCMHVDSVLFQLCVHVDSILSVLFQLCMHVDSVLFKLYVQLRYAYTNDRFIEYRFFLQNMDKRIDNTLQLNSELNKMIR